MPLVFVSGSSPTVVPGAVLESERRAPIVSQWEESREFPSGRLYSLPLPGEHYPSRSRLLHRIHPNCTWPNHDFMVPEFIWKPKSPEEAIRLWSAGEGLQRENDMTLKV